MYYIYQSLANVKVDYASESEKATGMPRRHRAQKTQHQTLYELEPQRQPIAIVFVSFQKHVQHQTRLLFL